MKKYPLMGKYVEVKAYIQPRRNKFSARSHESLPLTEPRVGMVVGYRTVYDGYIKQSRSYEGQYDRPYFVPTKSIKVLLVAFWPTENPKLVLPRDAQLVVMMKGPSHPYYHPSVYGKNKHEKQILRDIMKTVPRDAKGRWM